MRFALCSLLLAATMAAQGPNADLSGTWSARFTGPMAGRPKMVAEMTFDLQVEGTSVTGMAHMASWPGDAPISEGKVEGDRISFTVIGKKPWGSGGPNGQASGYPKLDFVGRLDGQDLNLTLTWGSVLIYSTYPPSDASVSVLTMRGIKVPGPK